MRRVLWQVLEFGSDQVIDGDQTSIDTLSPAGPPRTALVDADPAHAQIILLHARRPPAMAQYASIPLIGHAPAAGVPPTPAFGRTESR